MDFSIGRGESRAIVEGIGMRRNRFMAVMTALSMSAGSFADQSLVRNGSMEFGAGPNGPDPFIALGWTEFGVNVERSPTVNLEPPGAGFALKSFGDGESSNAGASQIITSVSPGQSVTASVQLYTPSFDKLRNSGQAGLVIEFLNTFNGTINPPGVLSTYPLTTASPADTWINASIGPIVAPANTAKVRITCRLQWVPGDVGGAAYWDDAIVTVNGGLNRVFNGDFETVGNSPGQSVAGIDDWSGFNDQEKSDDVAEDGDFSLQLATRDGYSGLYQDMGVLNAGDHIILNAWAWNPSTDPLVGSTRVGIKLEFQPNGTSPPPVETLPITQDTPTDIWTPVNISATVPAGISLARVVLIYTGDGGSSGAAHFDAAFAERSSAIGVNQLSNVSFEDGAGGPQGLDNWTEFFSAGVSECAKSCFFVPPVSGFCTARGTGTGVAGIYQEIAVAPGETLNISVQARNPSAEPMLGGATKAGIKIEWFFGGIPDDVDIGVPNGSPNTIGAGAATNTWIPLTIDYVMPPGTSARALFVNIIEKGNALTGRCYIDSCEAIVTNRFNGSDADGDFDQDLADFAAFQRCYSGSGGGIGVACSIFDDTTDGDVDFADWNVFRANWLGPQ